LKGIGKEEEERLLQHLRRKKSERGFALVLEQIEFIIIFMSRKRHRTHERDSFYISISIPILSSPRNPDLIL
jgi:hypothetical protein